MHRIDFKKAQRAMKQLFCQHRHLEKVSGYELKVCTDCGKLLEQNKQHFLGGKLRKK